MCIHPSRRCPGNGSTGPSCACPPIGKVRNRGCSIGNRAARFARMGEDVAAVLVLRGHPVEADERFLDDVGRRLLAETSLQAVEQLLETFVEDELKLSTHGSSCRRTRTTGHTARPRISSV